MVVKLFLSVCVCLAWTVLPALSLFTTSGARVVGGLLEEHVSGAWETLDRELVNEDEDTVSFSIQLRQCNLDSLKDLLELQIANPKHPNYRSYWTKDQIDDFVSCGKPTEAAKRNIPKWLAAHGISAHQIHITNAYIHVHKPSVRQIETLFPVQMRYHQHLASGKTLLRARGLLTMPEDISRQVEFISGLTELQTPIKSVSKLPETDPNDAVAPYVSTTQNFPIVPRVLRKLYNLRQNLTGGLASNNSIAIAAFNDFYYEDDLCYAYDLLGKDPANNSFYSTPASVNYNGPASGAENAESSLDIQYATLMAPNVSASFWNHDSQSWILSWAQQAINITSSNGPWVWSISYGLAEIAHCSYGLDSTLCSNLGATYQAYIQTTNYELMKLGLLGVTVFVASGDDGAPGFSIYCPVDPSKPQSFTKVAKEITCPSSNPSDCQCGSFVLEYTSNGTTTQCFLPNSIKGVTPGQYGGIASCKVLLQHDSVAGLNQTMNQWISDMGSTCASQWNSDTLTFGSTCSCSALPKKTYNLIYNVANNYSIPVTLYGYQYNTSFAKSIFYSDFPTSSPYVVSVGATMIDEFASGNACGQYPTEVYADLRSGAIISGGGGFSVVASRPSWQSSLVQSYISNYAQPPSSYYNSSNRGYPDISLNGHNYGIVVNRRVAFVDGTSASSPSLAAMFSLINEVLLLNGKKPLGLLTPLLYQIAHDQPSAFNKIVPTTHGNSTYGSDNGCARNYCCKYGFKASSSGWDPVTGLGTPDMTAIENYIRTMNGLPTIAQEAAGSASVSQSTAVPRTVTTAGAITIGVLSLFFGAVGAFMITKIQSPSDNDLSGYKRHSRDESAVQLSKRTYS